jgi:hypothetical protein
VAGDDLVIDAATGGTHWYVFLASLFLFLVTFSSDRMVRANPGISLYYYKSSSDSWANVILQPVATFNAFRSRFIENDGMLFHHSFIAVD